MKILGVFVSGVALALLGACTASVLSDESATDESAAEERQPDGLFARSDGPRLVATGPGVAQSVLSTRLDFLCETSAASSTDSTGRWRSLGVVETCGYYGPNNLCPIPPHTPIGRHSLNLSNFCGRLAAFLIRWPYLSGGTPTVEFKVCLDNGMGIDCDVDQALEYFEAALPTLETDGEPLSLEVLDATPHACSMDPDALCITAEAPGAVRSSVGLSVVSLKR